MNRSNKLIRRSAITATAVLTLAGISACSDGGTTGESNVVGNTESLTSLFEGTEHEPPAESPGAAQGASVWWVSCGQGIPDCSVPANAAKEAAENLGINFAIADGKQGVGGGNEAAVRTALAAKPTAIIVHGISCSEIEAPVREAREAGVHVMGVEALDCSDTGGDDLYDFEMNYAETAQTSADYFRNWGRLSAEYLIAATDGKAQIVNNAGADPLHRILNEAFVETIESCADCKIIDTVGYTTPDLAPEGSWIQQFRATLAKNPSTNAVFFPFDVHIASAGGAQAVRESGLNVASAGGSGQATAIDMVRDGMVSAITGAHSAEWLGWGAIDNINRALNGQTTVPQGVGFRTVDAEHNLPEQAGTDYKTPIDFKSAYKAAWASNG